MYISKLNNYFHSMQKMQNLKLLSNVLRTWDEKSCRPTENRRRANIFLDFRNQFLKKNSNFHTNFNVHTHTHQLRTQLLEQVNGVYHCLSVCILFSFWHMKYQWTKLSNRRNINQAYQINETKWRPIEKRDFWMDEFKYWNCSIPNSTIIKNKINGSFWNEIFRWHFHFDAKQSFPFKIISNCNFQAWQ